MTGSRFAWSILQRTDKVAIGLFLMLIDGRKAEIHFGLGPAFWRRGLASEAGTAVMEWVKLHSSLAEVATRCAADHVASLRVLEKIGLHRVRLLPGELMSPETGMKMDAWLCGWNRKAAAGEASP